MGEVEGNEITLLPDFKSQLQTIICHHERSGQTAAACPAAGVQQ